MDSFPIQEGKFVAGKGENTYQEVINDFPNATFIGIITFNISQNENGTLISSLKRACQSGASATVVTNIPKRFDYYYGFRYAFAASKVIKQYINSLEAEKYGMHISAYFNFSNHGKIVMTNNVLYWGSGNYSDESKNNYECGVISSDSALIQHIRNDIFSEIINQSVPYYRYNIAEAIVNLNEASDFCADARNTIFEASYTEWSDYETNFESRMIYRSTDSDISSKMLQEIIDRFNCFEEALSVVQDVIHYYDEDDIPETVEHLEAVYDEYGGEFERMKEYLQTLFEDIEQLSYYNWNDEVSRILNDDYGMESFDENLEHYIGLAMDEANSDYESLIEMAEPTIKEILESLDSMRIYYSKMRDTLNKILQLNDGIDNTGVS